MRLVGESAADRDLHDGAARAQQPSGRSNAQVELKGVRGQPDLPAEAANELETAEACGGAQLLEADALVPALAHERHRPPHGRVLGPIGATHAGKRVQMW